MAMEVTVGPPVLTINNGDIFLITELDGSITNASDQGLYSRDTRFLSGYELYTLSGRRRKPVAVCPLICAVCSFDDADGKPH